MPYLMQKLNVLFVLMRSLRQSLHPEVARSALKSLLDTPLGSRPEEGLLAYLKESLGNTEEKVLLSAIELLGQRALQEEFDPAIAASL